MFFDKKLLLLVFGLIFAATSQAKPPKDMGKFLPRVGAAYIKNISRPETVELIGRLVAVQQGPVAAEVAGTVEHVLVQVGDEVAEYQVLVELEKDVYKQAVDLAQAKHKEQQALVTTSTARLQLAEQTRDREFGLKGSSGFSRALLEDSEQKFLEAKAAHAAQESLLQQAKVALDQAELNLSKTKITAPYPGSVRIKYAQPGQFLSAGDPVVELVNHKNLEVELNIPQQYLKIVDKNSKLTVKNESGSDFEAKFRAMVRFENTASRTVVARFKVLDPVPGILAGQLVTTVVETGKQKQITVVPKDAIIQQGSQKVVYVIKNKKVYPTNIVVGRAYNGYFVLESKLPAGALVVVEGNERLFPSQAVDYTIKEYADN